MMVGWNGVIFADNTLQGIEDSKTSFNPKELTVLFTFDACFFFVLILPPVFQFFQVLLDRGYKEKQTASCSV